MLTGDVHPATLDGIKKLAAELRKERGIKHAIALDLAAKAANYANFRNAQRLLPLKGRDQARPYVLLTRYWHDSKQKRGGRETLKTELTKFVLDICGKSALKNARGFSELRLVADDHLVCDTLDPSQSYARNCLLTAERSLRFMEHTGLQPSRDFRKAYPDGSIDNQLPYSDHATHWVDPANGQFILIDEPYALSPSDGARAAWATRNGWRIIKTSWPGMYSPYNCDLYVVSDSCLGYDLDTLAAKIDAMSPPRLEEDWPGDSSPSWDTFTSPLAKTVQDVRRARSRSTIYPEPSATTVPYSFRPGPSKRRPVGQLGVEGHIYAGQILKAVLHSNKRPFAAYSRLNSLRSTLEDWMGLEIGRGELEGPEFFEVYYTAAEGDTACQEMAKSRTGVVAMLGELKRKLKVVYPDCAPLRRQLRRIDMSISAINKMKLADD